VVDQFVHVSHAALLVSQCLYYAGIGSCSLPLLHFFLRILPFGQGFLVLLEVLEVPHIGHFIAGVDGRQLGPVEDHAAAHGVLAGFRQRHHRFLEHLVLLLLAGTQLHRLELLTKHHDALGNHALAFRVGTHDTDAAAVIHAAAAVAGTEADLGIHFPGLTHRFTNELLQHDVFLLQFAAHPVHALEVHDFVLGSGDSHQVAVHLVLLCAEEVRVRLTVDVGQEDHLGFPFVFVQCLYNSTTGIARQPLGENLRQEYALAFLATFCVDDHAPCVLHRGGRSARPCTRPSVVGTGLAGVGLACSLDLRQVCLVEGVRNPTRYGLANAARLGGTTFPDGELFGQLGDSQHACSLVEGLAVDAQLGDALRLEVTQDDFVVEPALLRLTLGRQPLDFGLGDHHAVEQVFDLAGLQEDHFQVVGTLVLHDGHVGDTGAPCALVQLEVLRVLAFLAQAALDHFLVGVHVLVREGHHRRTRHALRDAPLLRVGLAAGELDVGVRVDADEAGTLDCSDSVDERSVLHLGPCVLQCLYNSTAGISCQQEKKRGPTGVLRIGITGPSELSTRANQLRRGSSCASW